MDLGIDGRTGLVTGASTGIGRAVALGLAAEGVRLAVTARRKDRLDTLAEEVEALSGRSPFVMPADFVAPGAAEEIAERCQAEIGPIDILVNNAGGSRPFGLAAGEEEWDEAITLNFTRHRQLTGALLPPMRLRRWGRIINITGKSEPEGVNGAFCAKAALHSWAKGLSREVGRDGITVNSVPPGRIMSEQIERNYSPEYRRQQSEEHIPVGRYGEPRELADLVCFLASPRAAYITGAVIPVDGGLRRYQF
jgi:3-oxoacyl-[acyl-carrier protein] reductase